MVQSRLNQHLNVSATTWTVIPVLKLITKQLFCEDALVLQGPSSFGHWENKMQLQIINNIQRLIRSVLTISKTFRLESEENEYLLTNYFPFYLTEKCCGTRNWCNSTKVSSEEKARGKKEIRHDRGNDISSNTSYKADNNTFICEDVLVLHEPSSLVVIERRGSCW